MKRQAKIVFNVKNGNVVSYEIKRIRNKGAMRPKEIELIDELVKKYKKSMLKAWGDIYVYNKKVSCKTITKRLKK